MLLEIRNSLIDNDDDVGKKDHDRGCRSVHGTSSSNQQGSYSCSQKGPSLALPPPKSNLNSDVDTLPLLN